MGVVIRYSLTVSACPLAVRLVYVALWAYPMNSRGRDRVAEPDGDAWVGATTTNLPDDVSIVIVVW